MKVVEVEMLKRGTKAPLSFALKELELYFGSYDQVHGKKGVNYGVGGGVVWDEERCNLAHARMLATTLGSEMEQLREIAWTVARLGAEHFTVACMTLAPRRWPGQLHEALSLGARGGNLVGLALAAVHGPIETTRETCREHLRCIWERRETQRREGEARKRMKEGEFDAVMHLGSAPLSPTTLQLVDLAQAEAERTERARVRTFFGPIKFAALAVFEDALEAYEGLRVERRRRFVKGLAGAAA